MHHYHPQARDAGVARVSRLTVGVVAAGVAATLGLGATIATAAPAPKSAKEKTDFDQNAAKPGAAPVEVDDNGEDRPQPPADRPESSSGDEQTTSGGS